MAVNPNSVCVFIPGFCGSDMSGGYVDDRQGRIWVDPFFFTFRDNFLRLKRSHPDVVSGRFVVHPFRVFWDVYGDFIPIVRPLFGSFIPLYYDFRKTIAESAADVANLINAKVGVTQELTIITHSMGGLVAAKAVDLIFTGLRNNIAQTISIGTPWAGSWATAGALAGRNLSVRCLALVVHLLRFRDSNESTRQLIDILCDWDALYELFPTPELESSLLPAGFPSVWDATTFSWLGDSFNITKHAAAKVPGAVTRIMPGGWPHHDIFNRNLPTESASPTYDYREPQRGYQLISGDGNVADVSVLSHARGLKTLWETDGEHDRLCSSGGALRAIERIVGAN